MHLLKKLVAVGSVCVMFIAKAQTGDSVDIAELSLGELMNLEVSTPGKVPETIRETPASVYLFSRSDIEAQGYRNLTEVLENVPGFYNIDNYSGVSGNFGVRGFWNGREQNSSVAILVNGVPQMRMDVRGNPMESINIPVEAIDRIEISRGPNTVIYGSGASFGAINIITDESYYADRISVSYGSYGSERLSARWSAFSEDGHIILNTSVNRTDGYDYAFSELMGPGNLAQLPAYGVGDPAATLAGRLEQETRYLQLAGEWQDLYFDFSYNKSILETFTTIPPVADGSERTANIYRMTVGVQHDFSSKISLDTHINYSNYDRTQRFDAFIPDLVAFNTLTYSGWEIESLLNYSPSKDLRLLMGVNWQRMQDLYEFTYVPIVGLNNEVVSVDHRDTQSFFTQFSYQTSEKLRFVGGFRIEELPAFDRLGYTNINVDTEPTFGGRAKARKNFTPRASLIYQASDAHLFKLMAGDAIKLAATANKYRPPEKTRALELNYIYSQEDLMLSVSAFRNTLSGLQIEELLVSSGTDLSVNTFVGGKIETFGMEVLLRYDIDENWESELGTTWQDSDNLVNSSLPLSYSPELVMHGKLVYRNDNFSGALLGRYVGSMRPFYEVLESMEVGPYIGDEASSYFVSDLNVRWDEVWDDLYFSLRVSNIFNEEVRYPNNPFNSTILDRGTIGAERSVFLTVGKEF